MPFATTTNNGDDWTILLILDVKSYFRWLCVTVKKKINKQIFAFIEVFNWTYVDNWINLRICTYDKLLTHVCAFVIFFFVHFQVVFHKYVKCNGILFTNRYKHQYLLSMKRHVSILAASNRRMRVRIIV